MKKLLILILNVTLVLSLYSCAKDADTLDVEECLDTSTTQNPSSSGDWISVKLQTFIPADFLKLKFPLFQDYVSNDIYVYKLSYNSFDANQGNDVIRASGLLIVPKVACTNGTNNPWVVLNHGTIVDNASAPTNKYSEGVFEASLGFVTLVPDYIGYGDSYSSDPNTRVHPYIIAATYASDGYSMMKAAKSALTDNSISLGRLYLKGYSEGGYATLALQRFLETDATASGEFTITASAPSAGPYSTVGLGVVLTGANADASISPTLMGFLATSYYYNYSDISGSYEFSDIFNQSKSFDVANLFDGTFSSTLTEATYADLGISTINTLMTPDLVSTLQTDTLSLYTGFANLANDSGVAYGTAVAGLTDPYSIALNTNDLLFTSAAFPATAPLPYAPGVTTIFYHCTGDNTIYSSATEGAYDTFFGLSLGASPVKKVLGYADKTHGQCPYIFTPALCFLEIEAATALGGSYSSLGANSTCKN